MRDALCVANQKSENVHGLLHQVTRASTSRNGAWGTRIRPGSCRLCVS